MIEEFSMRFSKAVQVMTFGLVAIFGVAVGCTRQDDESSKPATDSNTLNANTTPSDADKAKRPDGQTATKTDDHHYFHKQEKSHAAEWGYDGDTGPSHWGDLSGDYVPAKTGTKQSPIDITDAEDKELPEIVFDYKPAKIDLVYNGHNVEEMEEEGSAIQVHGKKFALKQFHFHAPSEHTIDGKHTDMEMHLVHKSGDGAIAVVGVMITEGAENKAFDSVWNYLPTEKNKELKYDTTIDAGTLLPNMRDYYYYKGSFTTPPCTEGVAWYVLTTPIELSAAQIDKFKAIISGNNRPTQPLNGRIVTKRQ